MSVFLLGSSPLARDHFGSLQQEEPNMTRRSDDYLPVPGEDKNLGVDLVNIKPRTNESIVRNYIPCQ